MRKINTFIHIVMAILIVIGIIYDSWSDGYYLDHRFSQDAFCTQDRIETFLMVITFFWFGTNMVFKPYAIVKRISGSDWIDVQRIVEIMLFGLLLSSLSLYTLWYQYLPNCQP